MQIAVASGKGGTGKTTVATSLALSLARETSVIYVDCDVEAPNGHLFLHPTFSQQLNAVIRIPVIDPALCTACGKCVEVCQFHALAKVGKRILVFPQLCHGCGSCTWNCPQGAIQEVPNPIGVIQSGAADRGIHFIRGELTISEPMPTPVIRQIKRGVQGHDESIVIYDSPPGASCSVVETLRNADFILLVTEPTPFGLHDLKQALGIVRDMRIPAGVIINRDTGEFDRVTRFCDENNVPILMRIPYDRKIARGVAEGQTLVDIYKSYLPAFVQVLKKIKSICAATPSVQNIND